MKNWLQEYKMNQEVGWHQKTATEEKIIQEGWGGWKLKLNVLHKAKFNSDTNI